MLWGIANKLIIIYKPFSKLIVFAKFPQKKGYRFWGDAIATHGFGKKRNGNEKETKRKGRSTEREKKRKGRENENDGRGKAEERKRKKERGKNKQGKESSF